MTDSIMSIRLSDSNLSCFPKTLGSEQKQPQFKPEGCFEEYTTELLLLTLAGSLFAITLVYYIVVWIQFHRMQGMVRINLFLYLTVTLLGFLHHSYGIEFLQDRHNFYEKIGSLTGNVTLVLIIVRIFWRKDLNIIKEVDEVSDAQSKKQDYRVRRRNRRRSPRLVLNRRYVDDMPPVFPNGWFCLWESNDLRNGELAGMNVVGFDFCVFRGEDNGEIYVIDANCPHLGANMTVGGRVSGNCVVCPFHGWRASGEDGSVTPPGAAGPLPGVTVRKWVSREVNKSIFIWHHAEADRQEPTWEVPRIEEICNDIWVYRGRTEHEVRCHIQEIPENGADVNHLNQLHSTNVFMGSNWMDTNSWLNILNHHWEPRWYTDPEVDHMARISLKQTTTLLGCRLPFGVGDLELKIVQIGPAIVHLHIETFFGKAILMQHIIPEGPLSMRIIHRLYTEPLVPALFAELLLRAEAIMFERNIAFKKCEEFLIRNFHTVQRCPECPLREYNRWYGDNFFSQNSPTVQDVYDRAMEF